MLPSILRSGRFGNPARGRRLEAFRRRGANPAVISGLCLLFAAVAARPAEAQFFSQAAPPPIASPPGAVLHDPAFRVSTPYMVLFGLGPATRQQSWFVKADASGSLTVTVQAGLDEGGCCLGLGGGTITATVSLNGQQIGNAFSVTQPLSSPPGAFNSVTIAPSVAGATYRINLSSPGAPSPFVYYRLKFDGAEEAEFANGPSVAPFGSTVDGTKWVMNVAAGEPLSFSVLGAGPCQTPPPTPCPVLGAEVTVFDPNNQQQLPRTAISPSGDTIALANAGSTPGAWVVIVVQHDENNRSPYRLLKTSGSDPGVYTAWFTDGKGLADLTISAPAAVSSVGVSFSLDVFTGYNSGPPPTIPTNQTFQFGGSSRPDVGQAHATFFPPAGWTANPSHVDIPVTSDATTSVTIQIVDATAPLLSLPANMGPIQATSPSGAVATFTATASDFIDGPVQVTCAPSSGSAFPVGTTTVECSASDESGNTAHGSFTITVRDTTPPDTTITSAPALVTNSRAATFTFAGSDTVTPANQLTFECSLDGAAFMSCTGPKAYTGLANGSHAFQVRAADASGNTDPTPASFSWTIIPFASPESGQFVIGNLANQSVGAPVYFWGSQWHSNNPTSAGSPPASFKGFASESTNPGCGGSWSSRPGNSSKPPSSVPEFMTVVVSSSVQQSGSDVVGNIIAVLVVRTNPGYGSNPGHAGTGTVVAVLCHQ